jgi:hypothetical protein
LGRLGSVWQGIARYGKVFTMILYKTSNSQVLRRGLSMDVNITDNNFKAGNLKVISDMAAANINTHILTEKYIYIAMEHAYYAAKQGKYESLIIISELDLETNISISQSILEYLLNLEYDTTLIEDDKVRIIKFTWYCN